MGRGYFYKKIIVFYRGDKLLLNHYKNDLIKRMLERNCIKIQIPLER